MKKRWTEEEDKFLIKNVPRKGIRWCCENSERTLSATRTRCQLLKVKHKKYIIDVENLISFNSPEAVYLMGLIWGDGYVSKKNNLCSVSLVREDMEEISFIFDKFGNWAKRLFKSGEDREQLSISIIDRNLHLFLSDMDFQIKSKESPTKILSTIPEDLRHYFWRGFFDADGCWYISKTGGEHGCFLYGSYEQEWSDAEALLQSLNIKYTLEKKINKSGHRVSVIRIRNLKGIYGLGSYIYNGFEIDKIGLTRKYQKFQAISQVCQRLSEKNRKSCIYLDKNNKYRACFYTGKSSIYSPLLVTQIEAEDWRKEQIMKHFGHIYLGFYGF